MDRLALHIEYLLLRHECVVIPDFGAFIKVHHPSVPNYDSGEILPMTVEIRFNALLTHDDGLLAASFARKLKISYAAGREIMRNSITDLRQALSIDGEVAIGRLGVIRLNEDNRLSFHPFYNAMELSARLGYIPIPNPALTASSIKKVIKPLVTNDSQNISNIDSSPAAENTLRRFDINRNYYIPVNKRLIHYAACIIAIIAIGVSAYVPVNRYMLTDQASVIPVKTVVETIAPSLQSQDTPDKPEIITHSPEQTDEAEMAEPMRWHLIVATFHTAHDAETFIAANKNKGYELTDISSKTLHRVSAVSSSNRLELLNLINDRQFQEKFPQSWVYEQK